MMNKMIRNLSEPSGEKLAAFVERLELHPGGPDTQWLDTARKSAYDEIRGKGLPHSKLESWEFSQVRKVLADTYISPGASMPKSLILELLENPLARAGSQFLVTVNGRLDPRFSDSGNLPEGLRLLSLSEVEEFPDVKSWLEGAFSVAGAEESFTGLNLMLGRDPLILYLEPGRKLERDLEIISLSSGASDHRAFINPSLVFLAGEDSSCTLHEIHLGAPDGLYLSNSISAISLKERSSVNHVKVVSENSQGYHMGRIKASLGAGSRLKTHAVMNSGSILRNEVETDLNGSGARAELFGLYLATGRQQIENNTCIRHNQPDCVSREHYKGILDDNSRALFRGRIVVAEDAQQTDSEQANNNLLLSADARINSKPQLEIYADDVSCTHGATVGQLEEEKLFYLQSRGISKKRATGFMVRAFGNEIVDKIDSKKLREVLQEGLIATLGAA